MKELEKKRTKITIQLTPWLMKPRGLMKHSQGLSNITYPDPNQPNIYRPRGKESTEVRITQNKGKTEEITIEKAHANTRKLN